MRRAQPGGGHEVSSFASEGEIHDSSVLLPGRAARSPRGSREPVADPRRVWPPRRTTTSCSSGNSGGGSPGRKQIRLLQ